MYVTTPTEVDHLEFLRNVEKRKYMDLIFWTKPYKMFSEVQFIVNNKDKELFMERIHHYNLEVKLLTDNVDEAFRRQATTKYFRLRPETYSWESYHTLDDIYQWMSDISVKYPGIAEIQSIGKSTGGKQIYVINIRKSENKPCVIVEAGIHGNEWITVEFATYLVHKLITVDMNYNSELGNLASAYSWHVMPIVNPDGFIYSHTVDRLWRKNRRAMKGGTGVDLNRNFDYKFGTHDCSPDVNDDRYCGPKAFSEPETVAVSQFVTERSNNSLKFYFSIHSFGQKILIPYEDRVQHLDNYKEMENFCKQAIIEMYKLNGVKYDVGTAYDTLGQRISGSSASWVKKTFHLRYVATFLLRDSGTYGHALPPSEILPACEEGIIGLTKIMTAKPKKLRLNLFSSSSVTFSRDVPVSVFLLFVFFCLP